MNGRTRSRASLRLALILATIVALLASGAIVWAWKPWASIAGQNLAETIALEAVTAQVERGTLVSQLRLNATLGYGEPLELPAAPGVITALPAPGEVIAVGSAVYEADGRPVTLLKGERPFWRDLATGIDDGQDVLQLEQNLAELGFFEQQPDTRFDWWTSHAVGLWQESLGLPVTGTVAASELIAVNAQSVRVSGVTGRPGQTGVSPLSYTATELRAVIKLTPAQARTLQVGTPVAVLLPDGTELEQTLVAVDPGGQPTGEGEQTAPPTAVIEFADQGLLVATGPAPVRVIVQSEHQSEETLILPVTALIATAGGGYAVEVRKGDQIVRVPVRIGLVADARAQILASGSEVEDEPAAAPALAVGDEVVISR